LYSIWSSLFWLLFFNCFLDLFYFSILSFVILFHLIFIPDLVLILLIAIFLIFVSFSWFILFLNFVPYYFILFNFYTKFDSHCFDCYLLYVFNFGWLGILFHDFFMYVLYGAIVISWHMSQVLKISLVWFQSFFRCFFILNFFFSFILRY